jgi:UDP-glucose 4-epimerase
VVAANLAAAAAPAEACSGHVYNIAGGEAYTLLDILTSLGKLLGVEPQPEFVETRAGDVRHSRADPSAAARDLGYRAEVSLDDGLRATVDWLKTLA